MANAAILANSTGYKNTTQGNEPVRLVMKWPFLTKATKLRGNRKQRKILITNEW